jgi:hypothetical protein
MSKKLASPMELGYNPWFTPRLLFQGMIAFALFKSTRQRRYLKWGVASMKKMESFLRGGNVNCHHMLLLLRAEHASIVSKNQDDVQRAFDDAVILSEKFGVLHNQALANERAGMYFLEQKDTVWAGIYLTRAFELYTLWSARAKALHLEAKFRGLIDKTNADVSTKMFKARTRLDNVAVVRQ